MDIERDSNSSSENDVPKQTRIEVDVHQIQSPEEEVPQVRAFNQSSKACAIDVASFHGSFDAFRSPGPKWSSTIRHVTGRPTEHAIHSKKTFATSTKHEESVKKRKPEPVKFGNSLKKYIKELFLERSEMRNQHRGNREEIDRTEVILQAEAMRYKIWTNIRKLREELNDNLRTIE